MPGSPTFANHQPTCVFYFNNNANCGRSVARGLGELFWTLSPSSGIPEKGLRVSQRALVSHGLPNNEGGVLCFISRIQSGPPQCGQPGSYTTYSTTVYGTWCSTVVS